MMLSRPAPLGGEFEPWVRSRYVLQLTASRHTCETFQKRIEEFRVVVGKFETQCSGIGPRSGVVNHSVFQEFSECVRLVLWERGETFWSPAAGCSNIFEFCNEANVIDQETEILIDKETEISSPIFNGTILENNKTSVTSPTYNGTLITENIISTSHYQKAGQGEPFQHNRSFSFIKKSKEQESDEESISKPSRNNSDVQEDSNLPMMKRSSHGNKNRKLQKNDLETQKCEIEGKFENDVDVQPAPIIPKRKSKRRSKKVNGNNNSLSRHQSS